MKKTKIDILIFAFLLIVIFTKTILAKEVPVNVEKKSIKVEVVKIVANSNVDIDLPFSSAEKTTVKNGLALTAKEDEAMNVVLNGQTLDYSQVNDFVSALNKQQKEKKLSSDEKKYLISGDAYEKMKYFSRKKILDL